MPPKLFVLAILLLTCSAVWLSCGPADLKIKTPGLADSSTRRARLEYKDSADDTKNFKNFDPADYHVFVRRKMSHYEFTVLEYKEGPETRPDGSAPPDRAIEAQFILLMKDSTTGKKDTVVLGEITSMGESDRLRILDLTKDLESSSLVFELDWQGESDNIYSVVYGFKGDTLSELFYVPASGGLTDLKRKDRNTLMGHCAGSDELLYWGRRDYIITVTLPGYDVDVHPPDTMDFDRDTEATDTIHAFRRGASNGKPYVIYPGTPLHIDTFFYKLNTITFHLGDSIYLRADKDALTLKLKGNTAG